MWGFYADDLTFSRLNLYISILENTNRTHIAWFFYRSMSETPAKSTILLLGGTGKIARRVAPLLITKGYSVLLASRSPKNAPNDKYEYIRFDWSDPDTYRAPFDGRSNPVSAIYLIPPPTPNAFPLMKAFIDTAISRNVKRLVLLSGSVLHVGDGPVLKTVAEYIISLGVEYAILRPTWFMGMSHTPPILPRKATR